MNLNLLERNKKGDFMKKTKENAGFLTLIVCGIITVLLIVGCVFFPDKIFGIFQ